MPPSACPCRSVFGIDLPATFLFDYPTIEAVAEEVAGRVSDASLGYAAPVPAADADADALHADASAAGGSQPAEAAVERPAAAAAAGGLGKPARPINKNAPTLTLPEYFTVPSIRQLARASDEQLKAVSRFVIGRKDLGEVAFIYPGGAARRRRCLCHFRGAPLQIVVLVLRCAC